MSSALVSNYNRCRFCLNADEQNLMPLSIILDATLTIFDVELVTGLEDLRCENKQYMICDECDRQINTCVAFRNTCLKNDVYFENLYYEINEDGDNVNRDEGENVSTEFDLFGTDEYATESIISIDDAILGEYILEDDGPLTEVIFPGDGSLEFVLLDADESQPSEVKDQSLESCTTDKASPSPLPPTPGESETCFKIPSTSKKQLCMVCGVFVKNHRAHMRKHTKETPYACTHCDVKMSDSGNLKRHIQAVHLKTVVGRCEECDLSFYLQPQYKKHMADKHGIGTRKIHKCKICPKTFTRQSSISTHMARIHFPQRKHACPICRVRFKTKKDVEQHQDAHSSERRYGCRLCDKRFKSSYGRQQHEITHSGVTFKCDQCEKSYRYKDLLKQHVKKCHTDPEDEYY